MASPELTFRPAAAADSDLLADLVLGDAEQEMTRVAMALYGLDSLERVRSLFRATWRAAENWRFSTVAERDGEPVGMLQSGHSGMKITPGLVVRALRAIGPVALVRVARRLPLQDKVAPRKPAQRLYERNGFRVVETATDAEFERLTGVSGNVLMVKEMGHARVTGDGNGS